MVLFRSESSAPINTAMVGLLFLGRPPWQFQAASLKQELDYIGGVQWPFGLNMLTSLSVTSRG